MSKQPVEAQLMGSGFLEVLEVDDIGVGGLSIRVPHGFEDYDFSDEVQLLVALPRNKPFMTRVQVRHRATRSEIRRFGVEFTEIRSEHRKLIAAYVEQMLARGRKA